MSECNSSSVGSAVALAAEDILSESDVEDLEGPGEELDGSDAWVDLEGESDRVRLKVTEMLEAMPKVMLEGLTRLGRRKFMSRLLVRVTQAMQARDQPTQHILCAGSTQIYKTDAPAGGVLAGEGPRNQAG